jgi:GNAT superfamily N-acetyltransferase
MQHELEFIERRMYEDLHAAADDGLRKQLKLGAHEIGSAFVSVAGALPASAIVINISYGLGLEKSATREEVDEIVGYYAAAGAKRYFVQLHPQAQPEQLPEWLAQHNLMPTRGWMMFSRGRESLRPVSTSLAVRRATGSDAEAFARICCDAFDLGQAAAPLLVRLVGRRGWHVYMSFDGDEPAGTGVFFVEGELAYFSFGATVPKFRGRGGQTAVLHARIQAALDLGCRTLATCTGEEVSGDAQHSYNNILKAGFEARYVRRNFAFPKTG